MTWQQGGGDERRSTSPQTQERQDDQEYPRERRHKPSRSSSHTVVETSSIAAEPDPLRSQSPSTSQISPNLGLGNRVTSAPDCTPTRKMFLEKLRRTISGDSASTRERDHPGVLIRSMTTLLLVHSLHVRLDSCESWRT